MPESFEPFANFEKFLESKKIVVSQKGRFNRPKSEMWFPESVVGDFGLSFPSFSSVTFGLWAGAMIFSEISGRTFTPNENNVEPTPAVPKCTRNYFLA